MVDIAKCLGRECPVRDVCYRYTVRPDAICQDYAEFDLDPENCDHFWQMAE